MKSAHRFLVCFTLFFLFGTISFAADEPPLFDDERVNSGGPATQFDSSAQAISQFNQEYGLQLNAPELPDGSAVVKDAFEDGGDALFINGNPPTYISLSDMKDKKLDISSDGNSITVSNKDGSNPIKFEGATRISAAELTAIAQLPQGEGGETPTDILDTPSSPPLFVESAESIDLGDIGTIVGARGVYVYPNSFFATHIDTFIKGTTIASNIDDLHAKPQVFSVGKADSVITGGMTFSGVENSTFTIVGGSVKVDAHKGDEFTLTDSSYVTSTFKGNGTLIIETKSHATNKEDSFAIEEMAEWIRESIARVPGNAFIVSDEAPIPVQEAWKRNIPLYYSEALNLVTTYSVFGGVPLTYDPSTDTFTPALPLAIAQSLILQGTMVPAKNAAQLGNVLYYDEKTRTITSHYSEEFVPLVYEPIIDTVVPLSVAQVADMVSGAMSLPLAPSPIFEETLAKGLLDEVINIVEPSASEVSVYTVTDGTLTFEGENGIAGISSEYNETVDAINSTAAIIIDPANGVACAQLMPKSAYHYIDPIIERDFSLYVPKNGAPYALCLKKSASQQLLGYEGIVDFTQKEMDLKNIIHYKRYPLKNNKIADTLTTEVFEGKSNSRAELRYQPPFILLDSLMLHDISTQTTPLIARTKPSNYYSITEENIDGQKKRLVAVNWRLTGNHYTQSIPQSYTTDGNLPKLTLVHNVLIQDNGNTRTTILPPEHGQIATLIE